MTTPTRNRGGRPPGPPSRQVQFRLTDLDLWRLEAMRAAWHLPDRTAALRRAVEMGFASMAKDAARSTRA
jgi:hypothetical protein